MIYGCNQTITLILIESSFLKFIILMIKITLGAQKMQNYYGAKTPLFQMVHEALLYNDS